MTLLQCDQIGRVALIQLNRPEARHALSLELMGELQEALRSADSQESVGAIVLSATGSKVFCSGADLSLSFDPNKPLPEMHAIRQEIAALFTLPRTLSKPVIGAAGGHVLAGGVGLLLSCDLAVAAAHAQLSLPEVKRGLMPMMVMALLKEHVGHKRALEWCLTGHTLTAAQAESFGLINRVLNASLESPNEALFLEEAVRYAEDIAGFSPLALKLGKRAFYRQSEFNFEGAIDFMVSQLSLIASSEDAKEGIAAFFEKRPPIWQGR